MNGGNFHDAPFPPVKGEVVIVKYNAGNVHSLGCALRRLGIEPVVTDDPGRISGADRVIFPGVGEASSAMRSLRNSGLDVVLKSLSRPFLGICLGMQLMCTRSEENSTPCLGIFSEEVLLFPPRLKVPHMGWNTLSSAEGPLFSGIGESDYLYFVHSYYAAEGPDTSAVCGYILPFSAALRRDNYFGVQFHPEKSGPAGERILRNFFGMSPQSQEEGTGEEGKGGKNGHHTGY